MRRWSNVGQLLGQRRRRWANSKPALGQRIKFAGMFSRYIVIDYFTDYIYKWNDVKSRMAY